MKMLSVPKGLILDLDGTLLDTEVLALQAWSEAAETLQLPLADPFFRSLIGLNTESIRQQLTNELQEEKPVSELLEESWKVYQDLLSGDIPVKQGATELLQAASENGIPCAVATSSSSKSAERKLTATNLRDFVCALSTGDQVDKGKPDPEIFQKAASKLSLPPKDCWAAEDSLVGVEAAAAADIPTWMVIDLVEPTERARSLASRIATSLLDILDELRTLIEARQS